MYELHFSTDLARGEDSVSKFMAYIHVYLLLLLVLLFKIIMVQVKGLRIIIVQKGKHD